MKLNQCQKSRKKINFAHSLLILGSFCLFAEFLYQFATFNKLERHASTKPKEAGLAEFCEVKKESEMEHLSGDHFWMGWLDG